MNRAQARLRELRDTAGNTQCTNAKSADKALVPDQIFYLFLVNIKALFSPRKGPFRPLSGINCGHKF